MLCRFMEYCRLLSYHFSYATIDHNGIEQEHKKKQQKWQNIQRKRKNVSFKSDYWRHGALREVTEFMLMNHNFNRCDCFCNIRGSNKSQQ